MIGFGTTARVLTGTVVEVRPDGSLLVSVLGGTGMRVRAIGDMRAGDPVVLLQADKQWVALGGRWAASDHTHPGKATGEWSYSTNTTIADPGSGNLRFSADGLQLAIAQVDRDGGDYLHVLQALAAEDTITIQETADAAKWAKYEVQGAALDGGGWFTIDLALIESGGGGTPGNNRLLTVLFTYGVAGGGGEGGYVRRTGDTMTGDLTLYSEGHAVGQRAITFKEGGNTPTQDVTVRQEVRDSTLNAPTGTGLIVEPGDPAQPVHVQLAGGGGSAFWTDGQRVLSGPRVINGGTAVARTINSTTEQTVCSTSFVANPGTRRHFFFVVGECLMSAPTGSEFEIVVYVGGAALGRYRTQGTGGATGYSASGIHIWDHGEGETLAVYLKAKRQGGTGSAGTYSDSRFSHLSVMAIPF